MTRVMYDAVTVSEIPSDATAVAGYVDGHFVTWSQLKRFKANKLSIAVNHTTDAACIDSEPGDVPASEVPAWVRRQLARGQFRPVVYASRDNLPPIIRLLTAAGIHRAQYRIWSAHYTFHPHICGSVSCGAGFEADGTQWTDRALGRNLDESLLQDDFFPPAPAKKRVKKLPKPHPKVTAAGLAGALVTAIQAVVHAKGLKITPVESAAVTAAAATIAGYLVPSKKKVSS